MPVELRKRKAHQQPATTAPVRKKSGAAAKVSKVVEKAKKAVNPKAAEEEEKEPNGEPSAAEKVAEKEEAKEEDKAGVKEPAGKVAPGDVITLEGFGGEIQTNEGETTTLKELVDKSKTGVVLFTYPKASTPGCTTQVCLFRDSYEPLTAGGLAIYGLSADSPKANTTFKTKQKLPYPLLCDQSSTLISAIGLQKTPKGTQRGVFVVDKEGKVLVAEAGGPAATADRVKRLVEEGK
ncbi:putative peroxiredoxin bcp-like protein [Hapsidospora chrysogenum ATCC 11550]|uniref:thioredoxin-dependent peroxiredoxin n=1 Tax=Hapsidospora chrysogenum (strain ATCC 11550 / CBS 779.69 / DSM 880 / IAM 14645 / JCM 23072 / IMI 49137) TaxID=857340 RepID=A0A086T9Z8_HAPC1|nr:putative peroxiredoxin bcp-like protein [Hapsidospora chrysogenum ATCC 11550]